MRKLSLVVSLCALLGMEPLAAQQLISLDETKIERLGLAFMPLRAADSDSGSLYPARVINSPLQEQNLLARFAGVLRNWELEPGMDVSAGTLLGRMHSPAMLELQQQWLEAYSSELRDRQALQRDEKLFADGVIAEARLQQTRQQYSLSQVSLSSLGKRLREAGLLESDLQQMASEGVPLDYLLRASSSGTIDRLQVLPGEAVEEGEILVSLRSTSQWLRADLPAALASGLQPGQSLRVQGEGSGLLLRQLDRALDAEHQTLGILAEFTGPVSALPGQLVNLMIPPSRAGILVPAEAVVHQAEQTLVYVKVPGGLESRPVQLQALGSDYLATDGLLPGQQVVVRGAAILKGIELGLGAE